MADLMNRMIRAAMLDAQLYEEVEADTGAMGQAMLVVILSSVAAGIGHIAKGGISGLFIGAIFALIGWFIWAYLTFIIGTKLLPEPETKADLGEMLRTIGFASSPGIIRILGFIPYFGKLFVLVAAIWMLVAMVIAIRQALDYKDITRAVGVCVIGWIVYLVISLFLGAILGIGPKML